MVISAGVRYRMELIQSSPWQAQRASLSANACSFVSNSSRVIIILSSAVYYFHRKTRYVGKRSVPGSRHWTVARDLDQQCEINSPEAIFSSLQIGYGSDEVISINSEES